MRISLGLALMSPGTKDLPLRGPPVQLAVGRCGLGVVARGGPKRQEACARFLFSFFFARAKTSTRTTRI